MGNVGESCTSLCNAKGLRCDAPTMTDIDDDTKLVNAAYDAGVKCETLWDDTNPNTPFYLAEHNGYKNVCEHFRNDATSSCETSYTASTAVPNLQRFCYCQK